MYFLEKKFYWIIAFKQNEIFPNVCKQQPEKKDLLQKPN